jgi:hypothetical protein
MAAPASWSAPTPTCRPADHQILPLGTAFVSDVGMTGDYDSVIGMDKEEPLMRFLRKISGARFEPATGPATLCGLAVETDDATGLGAAHRGRAPGRPAGRGAADILGMRPWTCAAATARRELSCALD